jgi:hypothetical protein
VVEAIVIATYVKAAHRIAEPWFGSHFGVIKGR